MLGWFNVPLGSNLKLFYRFAYAAHGIGSVIVGVDRAAENSSVFRSRAARGSVCNGLLAGISTRVFAFEYASDIFNGAAE